ncbi:MAG: zinc ribbon domain-containing protein [Candidatus Binataceae bacterium]|jgi:putative FmdB family regulatory protein
MPTYEYRCPRCGTIEINHSIAEPARSKCPRCGAKVTRLVSGGSGFVFDSTGYWEMGRDGREKKVPRSDRERQWQSIAGRPRPCI